MALNAQQQYDTKHLTMEYAGAVRSAVRLLGDRIAQAGPELTLRGVQAHVVKAARKSAEDITASATLLFQGMTGPAMILLRSVRETTLPALYIATCTADEFADYQVASAKRDLKQKLRLHNRASQLIELYGDLVDPYFKELLQMCLLDDEQVGRAKAQSLKKSEQQLASPTILASMLAERLQDANFAPRIEVLLQQVIDYWLESEVTHNGPDALLAYGISGKSLETTSDNEVFGLIAVRDLHDQLGLMSFAILRAFPDAPLPPRPPVDEYLSTLRQRAQEWLQSLIVEDEMGAEAP